MTRKQLLTALLPLAALLLVYAGTLHAIPNGSAHYFMLDVGETQIVLNTWGTLHATGYPLYVMSGGLTTAALRWIGVSPVVAPSVVSLIWMLAALALVWALLTHLTRRPFAAALVTAVYGLTRTVWIHGVIPEVYAMTHFFVALLLLIALWRGDVRGRVLWLASIGGLGIGHHRAIAMLIPALIYAAWDEVKPVLRRPRTLIAAGLLGVAGLLPYAYLVARAQAGARWVYGEPGTLAGLWDQFIGREASRFIGSISSLDGLIANFNLVNSVLITDLTLPGLLIGALGVAIGLRQRDTRRAALTAVLMGAVCYAFHVFVYTDVLSALILPVTLMFAFGWAFAAAWALHRLSSATINPLPIPPPNSGEGASTQSVFAPPRIRGGVGGGVQRRFQRAYRKQGAPLALIGVVCAFAAALYAQNAPFIRELTHDPTGQETIARVELAPRGATIMLPWGLHHHAVGFARDVWGIRPDLGLVDHKADYAAVLARGRLVTLSDVFYNQPLAWWEERIGERVYLSAAAPYVVEIATAPRRARVDSLRDIDGVIALDAFVVCHEQRYSLAVNWYTPTIPERDLSVFVHGIDLMGNLVSADQSAPVYGWRPLTTWTPGEIVTDHYPLPRVGGLQEVRFGLYEQLPSGEFRNTVEEVIRDIPECLP